MAAERRLVGAELDHVVVRLRCRRMIGGRPDRSAPHIAQVDELAARIARRVAPRLRHREAAAEAAAAAGVGHDRHVVAVRQELRVRKDRVRRSIPPHRHRRRRRDDAHFVERPRLNRRRVTRHALLQQQLGGLHARVGVKALHHRDRRAARSPARPASCPRGAPGRCGRRCRRRRSARRSAVAGLVGARARCSRWRRRTRSRPRGPAPVSRRRLAALRGGSIIAASAVAYGATTSSSPSPRFRPEPGDAEGLVLIGVVPIDDVVGGLRDAPRHAASGARTRSGGARPCGTIHRAACPDSSA